MLTSPIFCCVVCSCEFVTLQMLQETIKNFLILSYPISSHPIPSHLISSHLILSYLILGAVFKCAPCHRAMCQVPTKSPPKLTQDCFLQKEAGVCVGNAFVMEDSKIKWCFCCGRWASDRGSRCANVNIVVEWKGIVSWGYCGVKWLRKQCCENNKRFINRTESSICSVLSMLA